MDTPLLNRRYSRTLDELACNPLNLTDVWVFEPAARRREVEQELAGKGHPLRIHSAYKTLLHDILEEQLFDNAIAASIRYPVIENDDPLRFRLECYPLQDLFADMDISYIPVRHASDAPPTYRLTVVTPETEKMLAINVPVIWKNHASGRRRLVATGWQKTADGVFSPLNTEFEQLFDDFCACLESLPLTPVSADEPKGPFFEQLQVRVTAPFQDEPLPVGHEVISLAEVLHEEIYFTGIEILQHRLGLPALSRDLQPGQIVPMVSKAETTTLSIVDCKAQPATDQDQAGHPRLSEAMHWLYPAQVKAHLNRIGGHVLRALSRQGRESEGRIVRFEELPDTASLAISAAQHANETSGVVGALRSAAALVKTRQVSFSVCPVENVDGYALYRDLCRQFPDHMHHAARYTAGGNDVSEGGGRFESALRSKLFNALPASVHVNLHGYPAHEWTRPLSGYVPYGFSQWTIPKGFFLICRYADDSHRELAWQVLTAGAQALLDYPEVMSMNKRMLGSYQRAHGSLDFKTYHDSVPYTFNCRPGELYPITLITEAPDESVYGEDFRIAHEAQYRVVMAVAEVMAGQTPNVSV